MKLNLFPGDYFVVDDVQLMILGADDEHPFIVYCSIQFVKGEKFQVGFLPIHRDVLESENLTFINNCKDIINQNLFADMKDRWINSNEESVKTFFTIPLNQIAEIVSGAQPLQYNENYGGYFIGGAFPH